MKKCQVVSIGAVRGAVSLPYFCKHVISVWEPGAEMM